MLVVQTHKEMQRISHALDARFCTALRKLCRRIQRKNNGGESMSNTKHYPTHPGAEHPPIMTCEIPLEEYESLKRENAELKSKLESVQASMYCDVVDANMENRRLKRALWLARANRALEKIAWFKLWNASISTMNPEDGARQEYDKWKKNLGKFLKKAKEYL